MSVEKAIYQKLREHRKLKEALLRPFTSSDHLGYQGTNDHADGTPPEICNIEGSGFYITVISSGSYDTPYSRYDRSRATSDDVCVHISYNEDPDNKYYYRGTVIYAKKGLSTLEAREEANAVAGDLQGIQDPQDAEALCISLGFKEEFREEE